MLQTKLNNCQGIKQCTRGLSRAEVEKIQEHNSAIYESLISEEFGHRKASCHISPATFWVYSDSIDDTIKIKETANKLGYKNMRTFRPHAVDENSNAIDDPNGKFAVDISESNELIIGDVARKLVNFLTPIIEPLNEHIIYTYAHIGRVVFNVNNREVAKLLQDALGQFFKIGESVINFNYEVNFSDYELDCWRVELQLKSTK